jgi:hypothetical protein
MSLLLHPRFAKVVSSRSRAQLEGLKKLTKPPLCSMVGSREQENVPDFKSVYFIIYLHTREQVISAFIYVQR